MEMKKTIVRRDRKNIALHATFKMLPLHKLMFYITATFPMAKFKSHETHIGALQ